MRGRVRVVPRDRLVEVRQSLRGVVDDRHHTRVRQGLFGPDRDDPGARGGRQHQPGVERVRRRVLDAVAVARVAAADFRNDALAALGLAEEPDLEPALGALLGGQIDVAGVQLGDAKTHLGSITPIVVS